MNTKVLVDIGTLNSAYELLNRRPGGRFHEGLNGDVEIVALGSLFESIVFFDHVVVPGLPHHYGEHLSRAFGDALEYRSVDYAIFDEIEKEAVAAVCTNFDLEAALEAVDQTVKKYHYTSLCTDLMLTYGINIKEQTRGRPNFIFDSSGFQESWQSPSAAQESTFWNMGLSAETIADFQEQIEKYIGTEAAPRDVILIANAIYWTLFRCRCYDLVSRLWAIPYCPHPLRAKGTLLSQINDIGARRNPYMAAMTRVLEESSNYLCEQTGDSFAAIRYSPVLPYLLNQCKSKSEIMPRLYELRGSAGARAIRERMQEHHEAVRHGDVKSSVKLANEISRLSKYFRSDVGMRVESSGATLSVSVLTVPIPERVVNFAAFKLEGSLKPRTLFIRNVFKDFSLSAALGSGYELLTRGGNVLPHADGWSRNELSNQAAHCYRRSVQAGESAHAAQTEAYKLVRQLSPSLSASECWRVVMNACSDRI